MNSLLKDNTDQWQRVAQATHASFPEDLSVQFKKLKQRRFFAEFLLMFFLQYSGLLFSSLSAQNFPVWFASGTACGFAFLRGYRVLWGIWAGSVAAYFTAHAGFQIAVESATLLSLQATMLLWSGRYFNVAMLVFYQLRALIKFVVITALLTGFCSILLIKVSGLLNISWLQWWLANFNGVMIVAVALVTLDAYFPQISDLKKIKKLDWAVYFVLYLTFISFFIFQPKIVASSVFLIAIMGMRYHQCGVVVAMFSVSLLLNCFSSLIGENLISLQLLLSLNMLTGLGCNFFRR